MAERTAVDNANLLEKAGHAPGGPGDPKLGPEGARTSPSPNYARFTQMGTDGEDRTYGSNSAETQRNALAMHKKGGSIPVTWHNTGSSKQ